MGPVAENAVQEPGGTCAAHIPIAFMLRCASADCLSGISVEAALNHEWLRDGEAMQIQELDARCLPIQSGVPLCTPKRANMIILTDPSRRRPRRVPLHTLDRWMCDQDKRPIALMLFGSLFACAAR